SVGPDRRRPAVPRIRSRVTASMSGHGPSVFRIALGWSGETRAAVSAFLGRAVDRDLAQRAAVLPGFRVLHHLRPDQPRGPLTKVREILGQDSLHRRDVEPLAAPGLDLMHALFAEQIF